MGKSFGGRFLGHVILLKSPKYPALYTERNRIRTRVIPLLNGWRVTIRDVRKDAS